MSEQSKLLVHFNNYWSIAFTTIKQSLFKNAGYLVGVEAINAIIGFFFWGLAAQLYDPAEIGLASSIVSAVALVSLISGLGTGNGLIRFLPESSQPVRMVNSLYIFNAVAALLVGGVALVGLTCFSPSLSFLGQDFLLVIGFLVYGFAATFSGLLRWTYLALRQTRFAFWQSVVTNGTRLLLLVLFSGFGVWGLVGSVWLAISCSVLLGCLVFLPHAMPAFRFRRVFSTSYIIRILPYSFGIYFSFLLVQAPSRLLPIIVIDVIGPDSAAHAQIAWLIGSILVTPGLALATSAFVEASNFPDLSLDIYKKAWLFGLSITVLAALFMFVVAQWFLLLFGPTYSFEGTTLLRWLAVSAPLVVLVGTYFSLLRFQKRVPRLVGLSIIIAASTISFTAFLTPNFGITAFGLGWFFGNILVGIFALWDVLSGKSFINKKGRIQRSRSNLSS